VNTDAEEATALKAVTRTTTGEDIADWEDLVRAVVSELARSLNPITNPNLVIRVTIL
jgi:CheY-specific phosphatase CheX